MSQIINAIGIKTRILADCDFLSNILLTEHKDLLSTECDNLLTALIESINSGELSLNTKVTTFESFKSISSKDFIKICNHEKTQKHIHEIHQKLKDNGIYIWKSGDIEAVYGFGKKQTEWDSLLDCLCDESKDVRAVIKKYDEMEDFIKWI
ncbi:hypothetical protein NA892_02450 [Escherichia coli]|nr:hypothetical protein [Escherichia coli]